MGCTLAASNLSFGDLDAAGPNGGHTTVVTTGKITATCARGVRVVFTADKGTATKASVRQRYLSGTSSNTTIPYNIFLGASDTRPWGGTEGSLNGAVFGGVQPDPNDAAESIFAGVGNGSPQTITLYGIVPPLVAPPRAGSYEDTVTVTAFW
jgi:spore coat protein U-like protein